MTKVIFAILILLVPSCASGPYGLRSQRTIDSHAKPGKLSGRGLNPKNSDVFTEQTTTNIIPNEQKNHTGSLYDVDRSTNMLMLDVIPPQIGDMIEVKLVPENQNNAAATPEKPDPAADKSTPPASDDVFVKEMLAQLPQLDPGETKPPLLKSIKMRVEHVFDNGDVIAAYRRSSETEGERRDISITSRIPAQSLRKPDNITTQDLTAVNWRDNLEGRLADRSANYWRDEYSLRLSGYSEARSIQARQLDDKRRQLASLRERLNNQLISLGKERQTMARERAEINKKRAETEEKNAILQKDIEDSKKNIEALNDQLKEASGKVMDTLTGKGDGDKGDKEKDKADPAAAKDK
jgi:hypothetical protein